MSIRRVVGQVVGEQRGFARACAGMVRDAGSALASALQFRPAQRERFADAQRRLGLSDADLDRKYVQCRRAGRVAALGLIPLLLVSGWLAAHGSYLLAALAGLFALLQAGQTALYVLQGWSLRNRKLWWERSGPRREVNVTSSGGLVTLGGRGKSCVKKPQS